MSYEGLIVELEKIAIAYPEAMFPPLSNAERAALPRGTIDRSSADMARFFAPRFLQAAAALREQAGEIERLRKQINAQ